MLVLKKQLSKYCRLLMWLFYLLSALIAVSLLQQKCPFPYTWQDHSQIVRRWSLGMEVPPVPFCLSGQLSTRIPFLEEAISPGLLFFYFCCSAVSQLLQQLPPVITFPSRYELQSQQKVFLMQPIPHPSPVSSRMLQNCWFPAVLPFQQVPGCLKSLPVTMKFNLVL